MGQEALPASDTAGQPEDEGLLHGGKVMSIWDHLAELRTRLVRSLFAVLVLFGIAYGFCDQIIIFLKQPLMAVLPKNAQTLHFTGPMDVFLVQIKVAFLVAAVAAAPIWLYQFWKFFEPALYPRERRYILPFIFASTILFFIGVAFCYFVMLPVTLDFLITMGMEVGTPLITITDYIHLLMMMILGFGVVFETPVLIVLMALLDLVAVETLTGNRRIVILGILIVSAVATPSPDPLSQLAMAGPVYVMYEMAILVVKFIKKRQGKTTPAAETKA